jgi:hypothetical protein
VKTVEAALAKTREMDPGQLLTAAGDELTTEADNAQKELTAMKAKLEAYARELASGKVDGHLRLSWKRGSSSWRISCRSHRRVHLTAGFICDRDDIMFSLWAISHHHGGTGDGVWHHAVFGLWEWGCVSSGILSISGHDGHSLRLDWGGWRPGAAASAWF